MGREEDELVEDRRRYGDLDFPEDASEFRIDMNAKLEGHEKGIRIKENE